MRTDGALSEIVGALILVALVITGIGIVGVLMFSTPPPQAKEKVILSSSCMQCDEDSFNIVVRHEGGESINLAKLKLILSTEAENKTFMDYFEIFPEGGYPRSFFPAEVFSGMSKVQICDPDKLNENLVDNPAEVTFKTGDVFIIRYDMAKPP